MYDLIKSVLLDFDKRGIKVYQVVLTSNVVVGSADLWIDFLGLIEKIKNERGGEFSWFAIETDEGNGTIHLLISDCGCYGAWFSSAWSDIHKSIVRFKVVLPSKDFFDGLSVYYSTQCNVVGVECSSNWRVLSRNGKVLSIDKKNRRLF